MKSPATPTPAQRILLADSDGRVRQLCRTTLEAERHIVHEATNADELLSLVSDHRPDIIIADALLPGIDVLSLVRRLRSDSATEHTAVMVLTDLSDASRVLTCFGDDVDDFLAKPVRPAELVARIEGLAHRTGTLAELHRSRELLGENARALVLLLDFSLVLAETEQLDRLVREAVVATASLSSCRRVAIMLPNSDSTTLRIAGSVGIDSRTVSGLTLSIGEDVVGRVFESGCRVIIDSASKADPGQDVYVSWMNSEPPALVLPMLASEQVVGVLCLAGRVGYVPFTDWELDYLNLLSNCAASAIQGVLTRRAREEACEAITVSLASLAEHRDHDTGRHLERMTGFCLILAEKLRTDSDYSKKINSTFIDDLRRAAPLHDIGKVAIPDRILLKPSTLTADEMEIMRTHAAIGADTIRSARSRSPESRFLAMAEEIAHGHHEWFDGSGFPGGIRGGRIPLSARLAALADVYDALTSRRVYKDAMSHSRAKSIIVDRSDRQFDPLIVKAFLASEDAFERLAASRRDPVDADENAAQMVGRRSQAHITPDKPEPAAIAPGGSHLLH